MSSGLDLVTRRARRAFRDNAPAIVCREIDAIWQDEGFEPAEQLTAPLFGRPATDDHRVLLDTEPARAMLLRSHVDLPAGMRRVTEMLQDVGAGIAVLDVHGVALLLPSGSRTPRASRWPLRRRRAEADVEEDAACGPSQATPKVALLGDRSVKINS